MKVNEDRVREPKEQASELKEERLSYLVKGRLQNYMITNDYVVLADGIGALFWLSSKV